MVGNKSRITETIVVGYIADQTLDRKGRKREAEDNRTKKRQDEVKTKFKKKKEKEKEGRRGCVVGRAKAMAKDK